MLPTSTVGIPPAGVTAITGSFTVDLAPNLTDALVDYGLLDFSFFDGVSTYDSTNFNVLESKFFTDSAGMITAYEIVLRNLTSPAGSANLLTIADDSMSSLPLSGTLSSVSYCTSNNSITGVCLTGRGVVSNTPGTLTAVTVPEPTTLSLLASGLLGLGLMGRRRRFTRVSS